MIATAPEIRVTHPIAYHTFGDRERDAVSECFDLGEFTMWRRVAEFEERFADYLGVRDAVMVNSGSSADLVMMLAARELEILNSGDTILMPAVTWPTQFWAAHEAGFKVKLVDVDPETLNAKGPLPEAKALFRTHLMGNPSTVPFDGIVFEDCCEALGASTPEGKVGSTATASAFSFFFSHHICTMEGGMIATNDPEFADCCRQLRAHGWVRDLHAPDFYLGDPRFHFTRKGFNFRPTELQGAIGLVQLERLPEFNHWRSVNAEKLRYHVDPSKMNPFLQIQKESWDVTPAWFAMPFILKESLPYTRQQVFDYLAKYGIETRPLVGGNLARQPAFSALRDLTDSPLKGADIVHDRGFYIGLPPFECNLDAVIGILTGLESHFRYAKA